MDKPPVYFSVAQEQDEPGDDTLLHRRQAELARIGAALLARAKFSPDMPLPFPSIDTIVFFLRRAE